MGRSLTLLVEDDDIAAGQVDGVRGAQARHCCDDVSLGPPLTMTPVLCDSSPLRLVAAMAAADESAQSAAERSRAHGTRGGFCYLRPPPTTITRGAIASDACDGSGV